MPSRRHLHDLRMRIAVLLSGVAAFVAFAAPATSADSLRWVREASVRSSGGVQAVALAPGSGELAFADEVGVWIRASDASPRRALRAEGVADLLYDEAGGLWIGAMAGLWWVAPSELATGGTGAQDRSTAPGAAARQVYRLAQSGGWIAAATEAGVFVSAGGRSWLRIDGAAPAGAAVSVALACEVDDRCELWWIASAAVWHAELVRESNGATSVNEVREFAIAGAPTGTAPVDIAVGLPGPDGDGSARVAIVYPQSLALLGDGAFRIWRPVLPPGAQARRLGYALGRYWLATDRGLMVASDLHAAWQRAGVPAGWLAATSVASDATRLFVGTSSGVVRADRIAGAEVVERTAPKSHESEEPSVSGRARAARASVDSRDELARLHRLALSHLSLDPARQRDWRRRVDRRSWWPELDVQLGYGGSLDRGVDEDSAFISSARHQLNDRSLDRGDDWDASLSLSWDLPSAIFDGEVLDVAREERLWISLRDDVLDEINQLYFERRRVLLELAALSAAGSGAPGSGSIEAARLRLRADELAAGLDAWTGGAFRAADAASDPPRGRGEALDWQPSRATESPAGSRMESFDASCFIPPC